MRPLSYVSGATVLGHYAVAQRSGAIVATIGAAGILGSMRWAPSISAYLVLMRLKASATFSAAVTTATEMTLQAKIVRGFSVDFTTASTPAAMSVVTNTGKMRSGTMQPSQMGANGPRICTTTVMSGQTATQDADAFAMAAWDTGAITGTVGIPIGRALGTQTLYEWTGLGQHPVVLGSQEGIFVELVAAGPASGTFNLQLQWEWAEVSAF